MSEQTLTNQTDHITLKPTEDRIVIRPMVPKETTKGGIIIPAEAQNTSKNTGTVVAVGPGRFADGELLPMDRSVGDVVYFSAFAGEPYEEDGVHYKLMRQADILGVF